MCKSAASLPKPEKREKVESTNYGLLNLSSSSMASVDLGEILLIILLVVVALGVFWYICKKRRQQQLREMREAVNQSVAYRAQGESVTYPSRRGLSLEYAENSSTAKPNPTAPQGLWDQCRWMRCQLTTLKDTWNLERNNTGHGQICDNYELQIETLDWR